MDSHRVGCGAGNAGAGQPAIEGGFEQRSVQSDGVANGDAAAPAAKQGRRGGLDGKAKACCHVPDMRERFARGLVVGEIDWIDPSPAAASRNLGNQLEGFGERVGQDGPRIRPGYGRDGQIDPARQTIARCTLTDMHNRSAMGAGQKPGQQVGQRG